MIARHRIRYDMFKLSGELYSDLDGPQSVALSVCGDQAAWIRLGAGYVEVSHPETAALRSFAWGGLYSVAINRHGRLAVLTNPNGRLEVGPQGMPRVICRRSDAVQVLWLGDTSLLTLARIEDEWSLWGARYVDGKYCRLVRLAPIVSEGPDTRVTDLVKRGSGWRAIVSGKEGGQILAINPQQRSSCRVSRLGAIAGGTLKVFSDELGGRALFAATDGCHIGEHPIGAPGQASLLYNRLGSRITAIAADRKRRLGAVASMDGEIRLYDLETGKEEGVLYGHTCRQATQLAFIDSAYEDESILLSASPTEGTVLRWRLDLSEIRKPTKPANEVPKRMIIL